MQKIDDEIESKKIVPTFLNKLYQILENKEFEKVVNWSNDGKFFTVKNMKIFTEKVLPKYFKHNNYASFVRQLNMYDFHKSKNAENEFFHPNFLKNQKDLLNSIKRKSKNSKNSEIVEENFFTTFDFQKDSKKDIKNFNKFLMKNFEELSNKQMVLEEKVENLKLKNDEFLRQNQTIIQEVVKKGEYAKKLETIFYFILELLFPNKSNLNFNLSEIFNPSNLNQSMITSPTPEFNTKNFDNENYFKLRSCFENMVNQNSTIQMKNLSSAHQKIVDNFSYPMLAETYKKDVNYNAKNLSNQLAVKNIFKKEDDFVIKKNNNNYVDEDRLSYLINKSPYLDVNQDNYNSIGPNANNEIDKSTLNLCNILGDEKETEMLGKKQNRKESFESINSNLFRRNYSDVFNYDEPVEIKNLNYYNEIKQDNKN